MWAPAGLENQPEDNFEDRLAADIKDLHFPTAISLQQCHRLKTQLMTSTNRAHQPESFAPIPSHIERKGRKSGVHAELGVLQQ